MCTSVASPCPRPDSCPVESASACSMLLRPKVLVVDDVVLNRKIMSCIMGKLGFAVLEANNGLEACNLYDTERSAIVCVFLDLNMPVLDGWQTAQRLRQMEEVLPTGSASSSTSSTSSDASSSTSCFRDSTAIPDHLLNPTAAATQAVRIPVIVCTANDLHAVHGLEETVTTSALSAGADEVMNKPMNTSVVQLVLDRHVPSWRTLVSGTAAGGSSVAEQAGKLNLAAAAAHSQVVF